MTLVADPFDGGLAVRFEGARIDAAGAIDFKDGMKALTGSESGRVVLDLGQVGFIDSSGLGAIVAVMKQLGPGRRLELAGLTPAVAKVFRLTRMDDVFRIHDSVAAACSDAAQMP
ncbi:STAS domain-containing protein [Frigidibacter sp. ROC022]|uniref:STAS domain-containing protein n=1 Tax=Frigidibacter sp. ROC022 TaxID=2971796 RepID=UPI00215A5F47|nr:STAS domain-containing protein [Frigidibacter sp. ROC022]MCR8724971.1 STAS domain-containing protein [Frigidibacter sp. ROC022]